jgi:ribosomal protein S18 acetylase RimI-like enzyme
MENINIRQAVLSDLPYLYEICLKTGYEGKDASKLYNEPYLIGHYYVAPYVIYQNNLCFVAEYENCPKGYIVSVSDTINYKKWLEENWLLQLRKQFPKENKVKYTEKEEEIINEIHKKQYPIDLKNFAWLSDYPAHLHIDLLPDIQKKGIGKILMEKLIDNLKEQNISGIHLGVSNTNPGAISFYKKMDFKILKEEEWGYTMGKIIE